MKLRYARSISESTHGEPIEKRKLSAEEINMARRTLLLYRLWKGGKKDSVPARSPEEELKRSCN